MRRSAVANRGAVASLGMRRSFLVVLMVGCGEVKFVDSHPPDLFHSADEYRTSPVAEPIVWMPVLDLFVETGGSCPEARSWTLQMIRAAMAVDGAPRVELAAQDVSPACNQPPRRAIDAVAAAAAFRSAARSFPGGHVRGIIVYANNIDLPVPATLSDSLTALRLAELPLLFWAAARKQAADQLRADQAVAWTYAGDGAIQTALASVASTDLPLQSDAETQSGPRPLLPAAQIARARQIKACSVPTPVTLQGATPDGTAVAIDQGQPPRYSVQFRPRIALPRSQFTPAQQSVVVQVEVCAANCDRFLFYKPGDPPRRWNETRGCL